jgi:hypothetical protein
MVNPIKRFFLFCSGATRAIFDMDGCEVEYNKYAGIGATIFFTATLAALSGGYAMFTVFNDPVPAAGFGLLWGFIIFNLDRFIVSSMRKKRSGRKWGEFGKAVPRLILAVFISIVITRPIELRLFESEISGQITKDLIRDRTKLIDSINVEYADIAQTEAATEKLRGRLVQLQDEERARDDAAKRELEGWAGTRTPGAGDEYRKRLADLDLARKELQAFRDQYDHIIQENENRIKVRADEKDARLKSATAAVDKSPGLLKRLEALSTLTMTSMSMLLASLFIILLFISLETAPILVKLFSSRGPYDDYLDAIEHKVYATQQQAISDLNVQINTAVAYVKQLNAYFLQHELQLYQQTLSSLPALLPNEFQVAQAEVARRAIERWKAGQLLNHGNHVATTSPLQPFTPFTQAAVAAVAAAQSPPNVPQPASTPSPAGTSPSNGTATQTGIGAATAQAGAQGSTTPSAIPQAPAVGTQPPAAPVPPPPGANTSSP